MKAEDRGLDQARDDILGLQKVEGAVQIFDRTETELVDADDKAAEHADDVGNQNQERQHQEACEHARPDQIFEGVGRKRRERVDLLGHPHRSEFGRHGGTDPTSDHQTGEDRAKFARHRQHDDGGNGALCLKARKTRMALQRQDHAGEDRGQADDRQRVVTDVDHLTEDRPRIIGA